MRLSDLTKPEELPIIADPLTGVWMFSFPFLQHLWTNQILSAEDQLNMRESPPDNPQNRLPADVGLGSSLRFRGMSLHLPKQVEQ